MSYVQIEQVKVKQNLEVTIIRESTPPVATARVNVVMTGHLASNDALDGRFATYLVLNFQQDRDREWRVVGYQFFDPINRSSEITPPMTSARIQARSSGQASKLH